jgi:hypothetical protein
VVRTNEQRQRLVVSACRCGESSIVLVHGALLVVSTGRVETPIILYPRHVPINAVPTMYDCAREQRDPGNRATRAVPWCSVLFHGWRSLGDAKRICESLANPIFPPILEHVVLVERRETRGVVCAIGAALCMQRLTGG